MNKNTQPKHDNITGKPRHSVKEHLTAGGLAVVVGLGGAATGAVALSRANSANSSAQNLRNRVVREQAQISARQAELEAELKQNKINISNIAAQEAAAYQQAETIAAEITAEVNANIDGQNNKFVYMNCLEGSLISSSKDVNSQGLVPAIQHPVVLVPQNVNANGTESVDLNGAMLGVWTIATKGGGNDPGPGRPVLEVMPYNPENWIIVSDSGNTVGVEQVPTYASAGKGGPGQVDYGIFGYSESTKSTMENGDGSAYMVGLPTFAPPVN